MELRDQDTLECFAEFLEESDESIAEADEILIGWEKGQVREGDVDALFRGFHTMKGVAAFIDCTQIQSLAHATETLLNHVREGELDREAVVDWVLQATVATRTLLQEARRAVKCNEPIAEIDGIEELITSLTCVSVGEIREPTSVEASPASVLEGEPSQVSPSLEASAVPKTQRDGSTKTSSAHLKETIKVDVQRVDRLVEMIGELAIVESMVKDAPELKNVPSIRLKNSLAQMSKLTRDLQGMVMSLRMVPVRAAFSKMGRMVRDLSRKVGKKMQLETSGESTEMDRTMVEALADPLVHIIRNSADHGIESPEERVKTGKPEIGTIKLSAFHEGSNIYIEIRDDGRGLNKSAILRKAKERGLVKESDVLTDAETFLLIFQPGFSTAQTVSAVSGRGVGMDVVRRNIEQLRGRIAIESTEGEGTRIQLVLPLTLAVIDGTIVACGDERYIVPTLSLVESIRISRDMISNPATGTEILNVRGQTMPLVRLHRILDMPERSEDPVEGLVMIVEASTGHFGVVVDDVLSQQQVVIKSLDQDLQQHKLFSGGAILSDGSVGLIINVEAISTGSDLQTRPTRKRAA